MNIQIGKKDTIVTCEKLSDEGKRLVEMRVKDALGYSWWIIPNNLDLRLVTKEGKFAKRLSKYLYREYNLKLGKEQVSEIGNIANNYYVIGEKYTFDFTNDFSWEDGDFGDGGSCIIDPNGDYAYHKDIILAGGGFAMRFYKEEAESYYVYSNGCYKEEKGDVVEKGFARAFILSYEDWYIVFNGYGLQTRTIALILSEYTGFSFVEKIDITNFGSNSDHLYVNGNTGYAVGPKEFPYSAAEFEIGEKFLYTGKESCDACGSRFILDHEGTVLDNGEIYCDSCQSEVIRYCSWSQKVIKVSLSGKEYTVREECGYLGHKGDMLEIGGEWYCESCKEEYFDKCEECGELFSKDDLFYVGDYILCDDCKDERVAFCQGCEEPLVIDDDETVVWESERPQVKIDYDAYDKLIEVHHYETVYFCKDCEGLVEKLEKYESCFRHEYRPGYYGGMCLECAEDHFQGFLVLSQEKE